MKSFFLPLLLLLLSQLVVASPSSPLTSENTPAALRAIQRRQATPSAVPPPVCASENLLTNGNFQAGVNLLPNWVLVRTPQFNSVSQILLYTAATSTSLVTLTQTVSIPRLNQKYSLTFDLGAYVFGTNSCPITVSAGDKSVTFNNYCRTGDATCTKGLRAT
ncbi:hypothetical protein BDY24DRAFT_411533 [Mrakia frigida]|uniref:uncharacterized protein n=1 Tax=Mrakia frigida TaxID=29902 RepID=UPI003FCC25D2